MMGQGSENKIKGLKAERLQRRTDWQYGNQKKYVPAILRGFGKS
jgi:hypothetical protein